MVPESDWWVLNRLGLDAVLWLVLTKLVAWYEWSNDAVHS